MTASPNRSGTADTRHPAQWLALAIGVLYTVVGIWGFTQTGFSDFTSPDGELLFGLFEVNPLHNIVHLVIGLAGLALWGHLATARMYGWMLAVGYGVVFVLGLFVAGTQEPANFLALNTGDNWLHLVSALAGLAIALWPARDRRRGTATTGTYGTPGDSITRADTGTRRRTRPRP